ncbi:MAG TPA: V-type ATP synthase subunit A [Clostridiaceae bacterium]|nr:V-type ATP synthase subunit A [Clostridiaceae bacterium]
MCRINGPVVKAANAAEFRMHETVLVGEMKLIGEVIGLDEDIATIQVYEVTTGLKTGEPVVPTGKPLSVTLAPGLIGNIFDGIGRPLIILEEKSGSFIARGIDVEQLNTDIKWPVRILVKPGDRIFEGMIIAEVNETSLIKHKVLAPVHVEGTVMETVPDGEYTIQDVLMKVSSASGKIHEIKMAQEWPVRKPRPYRDRLPIDEPLITGQRVIDTFFPIGKGGAAAIPGSFGTGKTMTQHQLAKWSNADIIVYIGCGERGNEMTEVLEDFPKLIDPKSGRPLMERTILIANTSNMPVAAREASIYTGITIAEYYRDMGYDVAVMADSTSRWAEALREISGRLEEMPAEEGFPAYLSSRLSEFYERAGKTENLCGFPGSVTIIGAVSPQGGDFSEPVTQNTRRYTRCFWALDRQLAYSRHYPAINWLSSYSEYTASLSEWYEKNINPLFDNHRKQMMGILQEESRLIEIVKLIGSDILPDEQKLILEIGRVIRLGFLQQVASHSVDTYVPMAKQFAMMDVILYLYNQVNDIVKEGTPVSIIKGTGIFEEIINMKYTIGNEEPDKFSDLKEKIRRVLLEIKQI